MIRVLRCGSIIGVLMLGLACGSERPLAPSAISSSTNTPPPTSTQPPLRLPTADPVATYVFSSPLDYNVRGFTTGSQYLLYDNGVFGLRYDAFAHVYLGTYQQESATITFRFDGAWTWDRGIAMGILKGDLLEVRYSDIMEHSDFENAVYRRSH
jgi:hypothetical protein